MYASSPSWENRWINISDLNLILRKLANSFSGKYPSRVKGVLGINYGLHFTGGEPFLNFELLLRAIELAKRYNIPSLFVETNSFWCTNDRTTEEKLIRLKEAGLDGILISANPFLIECVPFRRTKRCVRLSVKVFGEDNVMMYHPVFYEQLIKLKIEGVLKFEEYLSRMTRLDPHSLSLALSPTLVLPMGRAVYNLKLFYPKFPAKFFFREHCLEDLTRPWHIHIDCYNNYIPGYCAGISLGDARKLEEIVQGVELDDRPILKALATNLGELYKFAVKEYGYRERRDGYISKCHLCLDIRKHIISVTKEFKELRPAEFYKHLC